MKKILVYCSLINFLLYTSCFSEDDNLSRSLRLYNTSETSISYSMLWQIGIFYPDTVLPIKNPNPIKFEKERNVGFGELGFNENDLFTIFPTDTLSIFFFNPDTLAKYDWEIIKNEYKILARYDLSHKDLKQLNWSVPYPPSETMKYMKVYLPECCRK
ncbi:MAG: hypothetical protein LIO93_03625 [Bacteroidales bacterium]|nr:hypothetical protein [Bacteroidales bacterium]